ncbi:MULTISPECIES: GHMP family kinase ATP-binding protein [unclassified Candidatus Frackibacter]|uniref:GHMP family kinase ATP-binding protein n=1 Tax=unclassified Candidatus Frackibacter TaxID=2648818 RepID=UPI00079A9FF6|nr:MULTISPECIES: hypothetical protein [unclassified Candidatus Frackibacter]KXS40180.1 MAG: GHMP kinase [Candidatus Frackibacter sp. T328-2]SDC33664.1 threonine kinase [Candidatus Frackibacter sp. WG11]SEM57499.1 threonine kinase [Candidatus Frackibacter sp. WG12]SFL69770.1 threonine kinase [Candidatus Frackibacter sp. WG13]
MKATVRAPGTCGELVQGTIDGCNFHITCPINLYSYVTVNLNKKLKKTISNPHLPKTIEAVNSTLKYFESQDLKAEIIVESELLSGKGMASSTADITAAILATTVALGKKITEDEIARLALAIEPTDGLFYPGIVLFDHVNGYLHQYLGESPALNILMLDLGGKVDTLMFNSRSDLQRLNKINEPLTNQALDMIRQGIANYDLKLIGEGATLSSKANQRILPKKKFNQLLSLTEIEGVLGFNIAHSGTLVGILYDNQKVTSKKLESKVEKKIVGLSSYKLKLINGGLEVIDKDILVSERKYRYG